MINNRRTTALVVIIAAYVLSFFHRFAPAGIATELAAAFHTSAASLGTLAATYFYVYTLMQLPTGILADTVGPRRIIVAGGFIAAAGSLLFALAPSLDVALAGRTLTGLGVSVTFIAMLKLFALWYDERRFASLVGLGMFVGNLGAVLAGTPLTALAQLTGWRGVFVATALASLAIAVLCWRFIEPERPDTLKRFDRTVILGGLATILRNRATWPAVLANFGIAGSFFAFAGLWATPYLMSVHGLTKLQASHHLSLYFLAFALGCLAIGALSDRLARRKAVLLPAATVYLACWGVCLFAGPLPERLTFPLFALMGLATSSFSLTWACAKEVNPPALSGMSTALTNMGGFLGGALLQPFAGALIDHAWNGSVVDGVRIYAPEHFTAAIACLAAAAALGFLGACLVRETRARNQWHNGI
ncbi:MAG: MFS transporter [Rhodocyclales bacterium]|nr:MFS transporter [Rhodocyclales bacterium]